MNSDRLICRAKRLDNGEWVQGFYVPYSDSTGSLYEPCEERIYIHHDIAPATRGQSTELRDKNGLIFEDDIILVAIEKGYASGRHWVGVVKFDEKNACYGIEYMLTTNGCEPYYKRFHKDIIEGSAIYIVPSKERRIESLHYILNHESRRSLEVIGNIHDNPELLRCHRKAEKEIENLQGDGYENNSDRDG